MYDDGIHGLSNLLLVVHDRNFQTQILANRIDRLINYTSAYSVDPSLMRNVLLGIGEGAEAYMRGVGSFWNTTGHAVASIPGDLLHGLLLGPVQWLLNAALIAVGVGTAVYSLYLFIQWRRHKTAASLFSNPASIHHLTLPFSASPAVPGGTQVV